MYNDKFDVDNYYSNSNNNSNKSSSTYADNYYSNSDSNKSNSTYDEVFKSYDNTIKDHDKKVNKNTDGGKYWKKIIIIILLIIIIAGMVVLTYFSRDKIIEIIDPPKASPITVELLDSNLSMIVGDTRKLNYTMTNSDDVSLLTFSSSDTTVANIDKEGNIKALGAGESIITLSYIGEKGNVTKNCHLTVRNTDVSDSGTNDTGNITQDVQAQIEAAKKAAEEAARKKAEEAAKQREAERKKAEEAAIEAAQKAGQDKAIEEAKKAAEEAARKKAEAARKQAEEAAKKAAEAAAKKNG